MQIEIGNDGFKRLVNVKKTASLSEVL